MGIHSGVGERGCLKRYTRCIVYSVFSRQKVDVFLERERERCVLSYSYSPSTICYLYFTTFSYSIHTRHYSRPGVVFTSEPIPSPFCFLMMDVRRIPRNCGPDIFYISTWIQEDVCRLVKKYRKRFQLHSSLLLIGCLSSSSCSIKLLFKGGVKNTSEAQHEQGAGGTMTCTSPPDIVTSVSVFKGRFNYTIHVVTSCLGQGRQTQTLAPWKE